jgi:hypothetical protein
MERSMTTSINDVSTEGSDRRAAVRDGLVLAFVALLSCLPYVAGLGLYSDDYAFLASMYDTPGSIRSLYDSLLPHGLATRPMQAVELAALYWMFELQPLGYHLVNSALLAATALLFHFVLRGLGFPRTIALVVPLIFALLPHYSTARFWIASFQSNFSVFLYFVSLFADLRFVTRSGAARWLWKGLGTGALVGSVLAYEVTAVLLLMNVLVLWFATPARRPHWWGPRPFLTAATLLTNVVFLALAIAYKLGTTARSDIAGGLVWRALRIVREAVPVHFGEYGLALPLRVGRVLRDYPDPFVLGVSVLVGLIVGAYLLRIRPSTARLAPLGTWPAVLLIGAVAFAAGYGVTLMTYEIGFHTTGANNRTANAAAIGVSFVFTATVGWLSSLLPSDRLRHVTFAGLTAVLAASCTLVTGTVAMFWVDAARQQERVIASIRDRFPQLSSPATLLLDGLCPYVGPAPVFATGWDVTGMLRLVYDDRDLAGDVVKPNTEVTLAGVRTLLFDDVINVYPFSENLVVFHVGAGRTFPLTSIDAAREYFASDRPPPQPPCPPYTDGDGADVF